jgi:flagellar hook-associated protein 1 FlgK
VPNDLLDQRDKLIADLNKEVRVTTHVETDGSLSVFIGSGQPLVVGTQNYQLAVQPGQEDSTEVSIGLTIPGAGTTTIPQSLLDGGSLGGLMNYRSETLDSAQNALGRIALTLANTMNAQHRLGQDLNGNLGGNLFNSITLGTLAAPANAGTGALTATVAMSDYSVAFSAGAYNITRVSDGSNMGTFATLPQLIDGVQISRTAGTPANGDVFLVSPSAAPGQRVTALATNTGTATLDSSASNLQSLTDSDYRLQLTAANTFALTRLSDNQVWVGTGASQAAAFADVMTQAGPQGFSASLSGTMTAGDSFLIRPTRTAARDISLAISDPRLLALGTPMRTTATSANTGNATISAGTVTSTASLPSSSISLVYHPASTGPVLPNRVQGFTVGSVVTVTPPGGQPSTYTIAASTDYVPYTSGAAISFNGMSFSITGQPADGDTFSVGPNPAGVADGRNAVLLGNLQTSNTMMGGSSNYGGAYAQLVADVGNKAREINVRLDAQNTLVQEGEDALQSKSGVNLDEEAANLMRYQQAYQASAKIISIADKLFNQLLTLGQ